MNDTNRHIINEFSELVEEAKTIVVIQAENPDGDSLASCLALEQILGDLGKSVVMYCPVNVARHLRYLEGWDRVVDELPPQFDLSIVVDTSSQLLMERVFSTKQEPILRSRPMATIDHHEAESDMPFATTDILDTVAVSTGEAIYKICQELSWDINQDAANLIVSSIMYDSLGLTTPLTKADSIQTVAELVRSGVKLYELDAKRRSLSKRAPELTLYKGELLQRIEFNLDHKLATVDISWEEIEMYSDKYNPSILVLDDMRMTEGVQVAIAYKSYPNGKVTAKIRTNLGAPVARQIAEHFGSGGHDHAAGFKLKGRELDDIKQEVITITADFLERLSHEDS